MNSIKKMLKRYSELLLASMATWLWFIVAVMMTINLSKLAHIPFNPGIAPVFASFAIPILIMVPAVFFVILAASLAVKVRDYKPLDQQ